MRSFDELFGSNAHGSTVGAHLDHDSPCWDPGASKEHFTLRYSYDQPIPAVDSLDTRALFSYKSGGKYQ